MCVYSSLPYPIFPLQSYGSLFETPVWHNQVCFRDYLTPAMGVAYVFSYLFKILMNSHFFSIWFLQHFLERQESGSENYFMHYFKNEIKNKLRTRTIEPERNDLGYHWVRCKEKGSSEMLHVTCSSPYCWLVEEVVPKQCGQPIVHK